MGSEACGAHYGSNPDPSYYPSGHHGPHGNQYGTTWTSEGSA